MYSFFLITPPNRGSTWGKASADFGIQKQRKNMQNRRTLAKTRENMTFSSTAPPLPWKTTKKHASNARRRPAQTQTHRSDSAVLENVVFPHVSAWTFSFCSYFSYLLPPTNQRNPPPCTTTIHHPAAAASSASPKPQNPVTSPVPPLNT